MLTTPERAARSVQRGCGERGTRPDRVLDGLPSSENDAIHAELRIGKGILHRECRAEGLGREILEHGAHDVRRARLDPLLALVDLVLEAACTHTSSKRAAA